MSDRERLAKSMHACCFAILSNQLVLVWTATLAFGRDRGVYVAWMSAVAQWLDRRLDRRRVASADPERAAP